LSYVKLSFLEMSHRENKDRRTLYCGNLHENVTEEMLFELFLQVEIFNLFSNSNKKELICIFFLLLEWTFRISNNET